jgi:Mg2+ and Co2+ transporter CorA
MTLLRVGHRIINLDTVATVTLSRYENQPGDLVRVFFNSPGSSGNLTFIDFTDQEAEELRRYFSLHAPTREEAAERDREKIEAYRSISRP